MSPGHYIYIYIYNDQDSFITSLKQNSFSNSLSYHYIINDTHTIMKIWRIHYSYSAR